MVAELRASLSEVEKQIDQYFRNPAAREVLIPVPGQLSSMRGVLSLLDLDQASQAVVRMRDDVDALAYDIASLLGLVYSHLGRFADAVTEYDRALRVLAAEPDQVAQRRNQQNATLLGNSAPRDNRPLEARADVLVYTVRVEIVPAVIVRFTSAACTASRVPVSVCD